MRFTVTGEKVPGATSTQWSGYGGAVGRGYSGAAGEGYNGVIGGVTLV